MQTITASQGTGTDIAHTMAENICLHLSSINKIKPPSWKMSDGLTVELNSVEGINSYQSNQVLVSV